MQINIEDVKAGIRRLLPAIETIARLTPTKTDDALVAFLKILLVTDATKLGSATGVAAS